MFYAVLALLQRQSKVPSKNTGAISLFDTEFVLKGEFPKELSKNLHKAFELRQKSDYRVTKKVSSEQAVDIWKKAEQFVSALKTYLSPPFGNQ